MFLIIKYYAKRAVNSQTGLGFSPWETDREHNLTKSIVTRMIGCTAVKINTELKLRRLYFIRSTYIAAVHTGSNAARNPNAFVDVLATSKVLQQIFERAGILFPTYSSVSKVIFSYRKHILFLNRIPNC